MYDDRSENSRAKKKCGYSQIDVAKKLSVSRQAVSRWEMDAAAPDTYNLIALAEMLGVTVEYITLGREAADAVAAEPTPTEKSPMNILNIIFITLAVWVGVGVLLVYILPMFKGWNVYNSFNLLPYVVIPFPFALMGKRIHRLNIRGIMWLYLAAFAVSFFVSAICFGYMAIYMVTNKSLNTLEFMLFDGGGRVSYYFWGLLLIHMSVLLAFFRLRKINMLGRILITVLYIPVILFIGDSAIELFGYGEFYVNHWWWTVACALIYWASLGIYLLIKSKKFTINSHSS